MLQALKMCCALSFFCLLVVVSGAHAAEESVSDIKARYRAGQTFITWGDIAKGEENANFLYRVYRSDKPITQENLSAATVAVDGVLYNSAKLFGYSFKASDRIDPEKPKMRLGADQPELPDWSGLAVCTVKQAGDAYYAVVATDKQGKIVSKIVPGKSATTEAVHEKVAPIEPIKLGDSTERGRYARIVKVTGEKNLPLMVSLHASQGAGGGPSEHGDLYYYFATDTMGYRDGLPGYYSLTERNYTQKDSSYRTLILVSRDAIVRPDGARAMETLWFGYYCVPQNAEHKEPRAYPFTERRMLWVIDQAINTYGVDKNRIYASGGSMGAWGSQTFAFRHPELFAAVYPNRPRTQQKGLASLVKRDRRQRDGVMMFDGKTNFFERMDMAKFALDHPEDLPFLGWCCGRRDGFASWQEQINMVEAMTKAKHGFAFAWNNGDHSSGAKPMSEIQKYYPAKLFARNQSYPAFGNSSIDGNLGSGDPKDGDMEGGINLGFAWSDIVDEAGKWSVSLSNSLAQKTMTVDVTPRRLQNFKLAANQKVRWTNTAGGKGELQADANGLVTAEKISIEPGKSTTLTFEIVK